MNALIMKAYQRKQSDGDEIKPRYEGEATPPPPARPEQDPTGSAAYAPEYYRVYHD